LQELQLSVFEYIEGFYNSKRPHASLGMMTPNEKEEWYWDRPRQLFSDVFLKNRVYSLDYGSSYLLLSD